MAQTMSGMDHGLPVPHHLFGYADADPVNRLDPSGYRFVDSAILTVVVTDITIPKYANKIPKNPAELYGIAVGVCKAIARFEVALRILSSTIGPEGADAVLEALLKECEDLAP